MATYLQTPVLQGKNLACSLDFPMGDSSFESPEKLNFVVIVTDFQIADQKQKCFLKEIKNEIPLTPLFYAFLHG